MKVKIPDELKADVPPSKWGKMLTATPIVMTVVATMLAGLSSSEMTRAQYDRSLAAQQQSKAGDQWSFFQAKRLRGAMQRSTLELLEATVEVHPLDVSKLSANTGEKTIAALQKSELPFNFEALQLPLNDRKALDAIASSKPEGEIIDLVTKLTDRNLIDDLTEAKRQAQLLDEATKPINESIDQLQKNLTETDKSSARDFMVARLRYTTARYDAEAKLNQTVANVLELQVRKNNLSAERHHARSQRFFYGMLAAQMAVIIATFAIAARQRNLLWGIAAAAGVAAIALSVYVYLFV